MSLLKSCRNAPPRVQDAIASSEPYHGGTGYLLRVLHDLNVEDKHSNLVGVGAALRKVTIVPGDGAKPHGQVWRRGEHNYELAEPDGPADRITVTMAVSFLDIAVIAGRSVTAVLNDIDTAATKAIEAIVLASRA